MEILQQYLEISVALVTFILVQVTKQALASDLKRYTPLLASIIGVILMFSLKGEFTFQTFTVGLVSGGAGTWLYEVIDQFKQGGIK